MATAVTLLTGLLLLVSLGHVVMDLVNARRDQEFYTELVRAHASVRDTD
jgi:hypothetical protein